MGTISFADVIHPFLTFDQELEHEALVLKLIDTKWFQRLRDISQTANTKLVYMFSEHSRFGHCVGSAYLACQIMRRLSKEYPEQVVKYQNAVAAAAILHDIGHLAPGSHVAQKVWFPNEPDTHELIGTRVIEEDPEIKAILSELDSNLPNIVSKILKEDQTLPSWTWQLISGGGWNVDRGNWCSVDSVLSGVSYGKYNINALTDSIVINAENQLALKENRLDAMLHFAISRHAMYSQIYQHRVLLAADALSQSIVKRARHLAKNNSLDTADFLMTKVLSSNNASNLSLEELMEMKEFWWRYHVNQWKKSEDSIISDLSNRYLNRKLFKTIRVNNKNDNSINEIKLLMKKKNIDPDYYLHIVSTSDVNSGDSKKSMLVQKNNGKSIPFREAHSLFDALVSSEETEIKTWIAVPEEIKDQYKS